MRTLKAVWLLSAPMLLLPSLVLAQSYGPNILPAGNFEGVRPTYVPWAGVDDKGCLHGNEGKQISVSENGTLTGAKFGPSVATADLNGDGKPDLVVADTKGFFWLYLNSGTAQQPAFTQGEVIPIWLGDERVAIDTEAVDNVVPRIQLVDFDGSKRLDILAGAYSGKLFRIPNVGSTAKPDFRPTYLRDSMRIKTHKGGLLWCNYMAPFLTNLFGAQNGLDLIMGEGTYSANSIYFLRNTGSAPSPEFDEDHLQKIIPGMGLEQLTPCALDWNNDGKPDIITGDRTGYLTLYLNNSTDADHPTFAPGVHVKIAGVEKLGNSITVAVGDLTGNHLPNLLIGTDDGTILYALNTGTLGAPVFNTAATPLKGVFPPDYHYVAPTMWTKNGAWGAPDELIACVNPQLEPGFAFPPGETSKYALKFSVWPVKNVIFPERYYPPIEDDLREHTIGYNGVLKLEFNKRYRVHMWLKAEKTVGDFHILFGADGQQTAAGFRPPDILKPIDAGSDWKESTTEIEIRNDGDPTVKTWSYGFQFRFKGQATFYIDDLQIQAES